MTEIYITENVNVYEKLLSRSSRHIPRKTPILRSENGKPYFKGNPLFFSLSHSGNVAVFAIGSSPVGIDIEMVKMREYPLITARFTERERKEILNLTDFYRHWTIKESVIKIFDLPLISYKRIEYFSGGVYLDGNKLELAVSTFVENGYVLSICCEKKENLSVENI